MKDKQFLINNNVDIDSSLELFGDIETYNDTIGDFLTGTGEKIMKLKNYLEVKDMANYAIYVHSLKSDARYFGFTKLGDMSYEHEMKSKANDYNFVQTNFLALVNEANKTLKIVKEYMGIEEEVKAPVVEQPVQQTVQQEPIVEIPKPLVVARDVPILSAKTVLVADDSKIIREFVKKAFEKLYVVVEVENGKEVIDILNNPANHTHISAMLLDINMPVMDGHKVLEYMNSLNLLKDIPTIVISGDSTKETIDKIYKYQIVDMLVKPFGEQDIKLAIEKALYYGEVI